MLLEAIQDPSGFIVTTHGVLWAAAALILLISCFETIRRVFFKPALRLFRRTNNFLDDWDGIPDRPGVPGRPGVLVRLSAVEADKVDKAEFRQLAAEVAEKASAEELTRLSQLLEYASDIEPRIPHIREVAPRSP